MKKIYKSLTEFVLSCRYIALISVAILLTTSSFAVNVFQWKNIQIQAKEQTLLQVLSQIEKEANCKIVYVNTLVDKHKGITINMKNAKVQDVLDKALAGTNLTYSIVNEVITISQIQTPQPQTKAQQKKITVSGKVISSEDKEPVTGATIIVVGTSVGAITDDKGVFTVTFNSGSELEISCTGMIGVKRKFMESLSGVVIDMKKDAVNIDDVVVTGYFERDKNTFTGAAKTVSGDEIRNISNTNLFNALSILDPSIQIVQNNEQGSNPNVIPELIIRGTSSLNASNESGVNSPLIVIDGVESNLRALYDIDISDIESATVLKDASATALYGEQAANGVILITRKYVKFKELRVSYNFTGKVEFPDLTAYDLMNAREKLDFELHSDIYSDAAGRDYPRYVEKLARVNSGIDTDWIAKPLRNSFSHNHSASIAGEGSGVQYRLTARYSSTNGVMKDDNRSNTGVALYLQHNLKKKLITTIRADYSQNKTNGSKYGRFQDYVNANPYDAPYDSAGEFNKLLSSDLVNPLYESTLSSFSKSRSRSFSASLNVRWNILSGLYAQGFGSITQSDNQTEQYTSPHSSQYESETDPIRKGRYRTFAEDGNEYLGRLTLNFNRNLDDKGSMISINAGGEMRKGNRDPYAFTKVGFYNDKLTDSSFGATYGEVSSDNTQSSESANVAAIAATNITFRNRYFADASYRVSGASTFGKNNRYAPFWSAGLGWNIHKESFMSDVKWLDVARVRGSYGYTGSMNFQSFQSITTYRYSSDLISRYGIGAVPMTMGNEDLKWQTTKKFNVGLTSTMLKSRLDLNVDYYRERTVDMIVPISMPPSTSVSETYNNVGEQTNDGFEVTVSGIIIRKRDLNWRVTVNGASNKNKLVKIGDALKKKNLGNASVSVKPSPLGLYIEGESTTQIYVVRSAGIDPASGKEIFIDRFGNETYTYSPLDKVAAGDSNPQFRGSASSSLFYKGFSLNLSFQYSYGGYIYNETRATRIEQINPKYNADRRAYTERWKKPGDVVNYLSIRPNDNGDVRNTHTQRFVEKENYLSLAYLSVGYEFENKFLKRIGFKRLNLSASMNEVVRFSTVKLERGTFYPYARGFSFTISPTF